MCAVSVCVCTYECACVFVCTMCMQSTIRQSGRYRVVQGMVRQNTLYTQRFDL